MHQPPPYGAPTQPYGGHPSPQGYGPPPPKRGMGAGMIALIVSLTVIGSLFGGCMVCGAIGAASKNQGGQLTNGRGTPPGPAREPEAPVAVAPPPKREAIAITATQLFNDYTANEVAADEKYKGQLLLVSGSISAIDKDFLNHVIVRLRSPNEFMPVDAKLDDSERSKAGSLAKGQSVRLLCQGRGRLIGRPQLVDCVGQ
ncbi:MAG: hypothetical protein U0174_26000 [Polyangiaceae bacterium]